MKCNIIQHNYTSYIRLFSVWYRGIFLRVTLYFGEVAVDWLEMKTCQTGIVSKSIFFGFLEPFEFLSFKHLLGNRDRMTNNCEAYDGLSVFRKIDC